MTTAWTKALAMTLIALPLACEVNVSDDPLDGFGGDGGSDAGTGGSTAGSGGSTAGSGGSTAGSGGGGTGGNEFPPPTCDAEVGDDACVTCLKQQCCNAWLSCNDATCEEEWQSVAECVYDLEFPDAEDFGMCVSISASDMNLGALQQNSNELIVNCANELTEADAGSGLTRCGEACFRTDIFFD